jgi:hypothetical protein
MEEIVKKFVILVAAGLALAGPGSWVTGVQTAQTEEHHPRIVTAIRELEEAIRYMEAAPHNFGGHKVAAIRDARAAIVQLRLALAYR